ncbi:MAG: tetratricopeptide repeat protein [Crocinitomicaceae bacterium]|nr:tetratricopeptide repeat protein [Crocinitomicaceae bacterium]MBK8926320.1 tetratricopeptide repeat protein [Crocinitomicaceae bacterium]
MFDDDDEEELFDAHFHAELERYEKMIKNQESYYFDAEVLEQIIDHFIMKNQVKNALNAIDFAKDQHPKNLVYDLRKAQLFSTNGKLKESLLILQALEKADPMNPEIYITKASVFSQLRDHHKAIKYYEKAIEVAQDFEDEDLDDIRFDLALEYENTNDFQSAIKVLARILTNMPDNEAAIYEIAYCYERIGNFDKCIEFYTKYIDNNPYSFTAWYNLGNIYFLKNNIEKALWAYDYAIVINEEFSSAHFNMGNTYMQAADYENAVASYRKCMEIDGEEPLTLSYLAEAFERMERYDEAMFYYERAKELNPDLAEPWLGIGIIREVQGDLNSAIVYVQRAVELQPENPNYRLVYAECLYKVGRVDEAEVQLEEAVELDPGYSDAIVLLAAIYEEYSVEKAIDLIENQPALETLENKVRLSLVALLYKAGRHTDALVLFESEMKADKTAAKTLLLYLPEAEKLPEFVQIIESYND